MTTLPQPELPQPLPQQTEFQQRPLARRTAFRPVLLPGLRRLWRSATHIQVGTDPGRAVILEVPGPACAQLLDLLDGERTETAWLQTASRQGVTVADAAAMLRSLVGAGLVVDRQALFPEEVPEATRRRLDAETAALALRPGRDAPAVTITRRTRAHVLVSGASQLAVPIACTLAAAGIGHLDTSLDGFARVTDASPGGLLPSDAHRRREVAASDALRRTAPDVDLAPLRPAQATFAVVVGLAAPATLTALAFSTRTLPHLAVMIRDGTVVVGPLVRPGRTACLNCLDLHRLDRDPGWAAVASQLATSGDGPEAVAITTMLTGAAYAAAQVLTFIDGGEPDALGATVEIPVAGRVVRRAWSQHPRCGCRRRGGPRPPERPRPGQRTVLAERPRRD